MSERLNIIEIPEFSSSSDSGKNFTVLSVGIYKPGMLASITVKDQIGGVLTYKLPEN